MKYYHVEWVGLGIAIVHAETKDEAIGKGVASMEVTASELEGEEEAREVAEEYFSGEILEDAPYDTTSIWNGGVCYHFEWNKDKGNISLTQVCNVDHDEEEEDHDCQLETYDYTDPDDDTPQIMLKYLPKLETNALWLALQQLTKELERRGVENEERELCGQLVDYLEATESKHYEEAEDEEREHHIYKVILRLRELGL